MSDIRQIAWNRSIPEPNSGCWLWLGAIDNGYAIVMTPRNGGGAKALRRQVRVSRLLCGATDGEQARHTCDVPSCVNPGHIIVGTHAENMQDKKDRNRVSRLKGEINPKAKLSSEAVAEVLANQKYGDGLRLADKFGVHVSTIRRIWQGKAWVA